MKKMLFILFLLFSTLALSNWKTTNVDNYIFYIDSEEIQVIYAGKKTEFILFRLKDEELKKVDSFFRKTKAKIQVDDNPVIEMRVFSSESKKIVLDGTNGKDYAEDKNEQEKIIEINRQMIEGKKLKVTFIKGKNIVEKNIDLSGFREKYIEMESL